MKKTVVGVAAAGLLAAAPGLVASRRGSSAPEATSETVSKLASTPSDLLVVYIRDAARGEMALMVGTKEVLRTDPGLVARLLEAVG